MSEAVDHLIYSGSKMMVGRTVFVSLVLPSGGYLHLLIKRDDFILISVSNASTGHGPDMV